MKLYHSKVTHPKFYSYYDYCGGDWSGFTDDDPLIMFKFETSYIQCQHCRKRTCYPFHEINDEYGLAYMCDNCDIMHMLCLKCFYNNGNYVLMTINCCDNDPNFLNSLKNLNMKFIF